MNSESDLSTNLSSKKYQKINKTINSMINTLNVTKSDVIVDVKSFNITSTPNINMLVFMILIITL